MSTSTTPETDGFVNVIASDEFLAIAPDEFYAMADFARKLERERNALRDAIGKIRDLVTTDHETKEAFIQRVGGILGPNI